MLGISTKDLKAKIDILKLVVDNSSADPTLRYIRFYAKKNQVEIMSTDLETGLKVEIPCNMKNPEIGESFLVPCRYLSNYLKVTVNPETEFEVLKNNWIRVDNNKVFSLPVDEYPNYPKLENADFDLLFSQKILESLNREMVFQISHGYDKIQYCKINEDLDCLLSMQSIKVLLTLLRRNPDTEIPVCYIKGCDTDICKDNIITFQMIIDDFTLTIQTQHDPLTLQGCRDILSKQGQSEKQIVIDSKEFENALRLIKPIFENTHHSKNNIDIGYDGNGKLSLFAEGGLCHQIYNKIWNPESYKFESEGEPRYEKDNVKITIPILQSTVSEFRFLTNTNYLYQLLKFKKDNLLTIQITDEGLSI